jgi:hypothetical protein
MKVVFVAGALLALAGLALGASLMPGTRVNPVYVSIGAPGAPAVLVQAPAPKPPAAAVAANSIARAAGQQVEAVAPVIPAPAPPPSVHSSSPSGDSGAQVSQPPAPTRCHGDKKPCSR